MIHRHAQRPGHKPPPVESPGVPVAPSCPVKLLGAVGALIHPEVLGCEYTEQGHEHRADEQQEVLVLGDGHEHPQHEADESHHRDQNPLGHTGEDVLAGYGRAVNVGEGVVGLVHQDEHEGEAAPGQPQDGGDEVLGAHRQDEQGAQGIEPHVGHEVAQVSAPEGFACFAGEAVVIGHQRHPRDGHRDDQVHSHPEGKLPVAGGPQQGRDVVVGEEVPGEVEGDAVNEPDGELLNPVAYHHQRTADGEEGAPQGEQEDPGDESYRQPYPLGDFGCGFGHHDDFEGSPSHELEYVQHGGDVRASDAQHGPD